ncbi:MAG: sigma-70 family RNA polymerase sigma factor [Anaerolineales bacterium]|nr:sigma-70 family RNA polymerase sigma factor [Anaerolineales bacterium]
MNDEKAWVLQAQSGDDEAFTKLVETYQTPVYNLCYRMLGEPEAAEDAAQEAFLKAYQNLTRYDPERSFATWLLSIAAHHCIDRLRRRRFASFSIDGDGDDDDPPIEIPDRNAPDPEAETLRREQQRRLQQLLQTLDPTDRAAMVMRYWHQASEVEIAQALDLTVPAVKSRLHRARKALAGRWQDETIEPIAERMPYGSPAF